MAKYNYYSTDQMVRFFMEKGKEGDCWDFKQEWHKNIADLIKDIVCFANTSHDEMCYLIFGVNNALEIVGMQEKRRKQADILDTISNLMFAGDVYPKIEVETISLDGKEIDVLKIYNVEKTPVYLKRYYGNMNANCIYMRIGDKNTPDKGNAHISDIEMLWKKRLGLLKPPLELIYDRLESKLEWCQLDDIFYNVFKPEYTIRIVDDECNRYAEFYSYALTNEATKYENLLINYQNTVLEEHQLVLLDGGRLEVPVPDWGYLCKDTHGLHHKYCYKYYIRGSYKMRLFSFLYNPENEEEKHAFLKLSKVVLIFNSENEKLCFENYINENEREIEEQLQKRSEFEYINTGDELTTTEYKRRLNVGLVLNDMLSQWRKN